MKQLEPIFNEFKRLVIIMNNDLYAKPRKIINLDECYFYHTMEIPGYGLVEGNWDLRDGVHKYLGAVDFSGKRVLEIGTASGFLCFYMERQGAELIAYDLSEDQSWDIVPFAQHNHKRIILDRKRRIRKQNNAFWLCHRVYNSNAKKVYGSIYSIPKAIGMVDISTFGCVLLHVRDPFLALQNALSLTKETVIITELYSRLTVLQNILGKIGQQNIRFIPKYKNCYPDSTWWGLNPEIIKQFIGILGFEDTEVKSHYQKRNGRKTRMYTVVGHRTRGFPPLQ